MKAVCFYGWKHIMNVAAIIRTADGLGFDKIYIIGRKRPDLLQYKIAMAEYPKIEHKIEFFNDFILWRLHLIRNTPLRPVFVELNSQAISIYNYKWKDNGCIVVGNERNGIPRGQFYFYDVIYIPMQNKIKCLNVACCASIAMYDYVNKTTITP